MTLRRLPLGLLLWSLAALAGAIDGRWEGHAVLAGRAQPVVLDITGRGAHGATAVITLTGRSVQRRTLADFRQTGEGQWRGEANPVPGGSASDALQLELQPQDQRLSGSMSFGGHRAPLQLQRTGEAVAPPPPPLALPESVLGVWRGRYDIGFGPRELTLRLASAGSALTVVGRRTSELALDEAGRRGALLMLRAEAADLRIDAPWADAAGGVLRATLRQGPFETQLELRREAAR